LHTLENTTQQNSQDLILFGKVTVECLVGLLGVLRKLADTGKAARNIVGIPTVEDVYDIDMDASKGLVELAGDSIGVVNMNKPSCTS
jgi:hypothetical protein